MPAQKWQAGLQNFLQMMEESDDEFMNQYLSSFFPQFQKKDDASNEAQAGDDDKMTLPDVLPILPLRGVVVYPDTAVPLTVGQPGSIKLVDDVVAGDKLVGLVAALDPELETPGPK